MNSLNQIYVVYTVYDVTGSLVGEHTDEASAQAHADRIIGGRVGRAVAY
jgi:hypothetical protein